MRYKDAIDFGQKQEETMKNWFRSYANSFFKNLLSRRNTYLRNFLSRERNICNEYNNNKYALRNQKLPNLHMKAVTEILKINAIKLHSLHYRNIHMYMHNLKLLKIYSNSNNWNVIHKVRIQSVLSIYKKICKIQMNLHRSNFINSWQQLRVP